MYFWVMIVLYILGGLFILLISREIVCWYFKINKIVSILQSIDEKLSFSVPPIYVENLERETRTQETDEGDIEAIASGLGLKIPKDQEICPHCGEYSLKSRSRCPHCGRDKR
jgi:hypothetical protein